jgi:hypothetical protein
MDTTANSAAPPSVKIRGHLEKIRISVISSTTGIDDTAKRLAGFATDQTRQLMNASFKLR